MMVMVSGTPQLVWGWWNTCVPAQLNATSARSAVTKLRHAKAIEKATSNKTKQGASKVKQAKKSGSQEELQQQHTNQACTGSQAQVVRLGPYICTEHTGSGVALTALRACKRHMHGRPYRTDVP